VPLLRYAACGNPGAPCGPVRAGRGRARARAAAEARSAEPAPWASGMSMTALQCSAANMQPTRRLCGQQTLRAHVNNVPRGAHGARWGLHTGLIPGARNQGEPRGAQAVHISAGGRPRARRHGHGRNHPHRKRAARACDAPRGPHRCGRRACGGACHGGCCLSARAGRCEPVLREPGVELCTCWDRVGLPPVRPALGAAPPLTGSQPGAATAFVLSSVAVCICWPASQLMTHGP